MSIACILPCCQSLHDSQIASDTPAVSAAILGQYRSKTAPWQAFSWQRAVNVSWCTMSIEPFISKHTHSARKITRLEDYLFSTCAIACRYFVGNIKKWPK